MSSEDNKILEFNHYQNSYKIPSIIYAYLKFLIKRDECKNNSQKSSIAKLGEHVSSGFSMSTISLFKEIENKHDVYRGKDSMKKFL